MGDYPSILGIFSQQMETAIGEGGTRSKRQTVTYWYVRQLGEQVFEVQPLNAQHVPSGVRTTLGADKFLKNFTPEPDYYTLHTVPAMRTLIRKLRMGGRALAEGDLDEAERQFIKALMIDELNLDANFGLGEVYSQTKNIARLKEVLDRLLGIDEAFKREHRDKFNAFGISLRKNGHYEDSIRYYQKSLEIIETDQCVYFNMARAYYDKGDVEECISSLSRALDIQPNFVEARQFMVYCEKRLQRASA